MPSPHRRVCLLAKLVEPGESEMAASFGNVLELAETELLLESSRGLGAGALISLSFYVPVSGGQAFVRVAAGCRVRSAEDEEKLLYRVELLDLDEVSRRQVAAYVGSGGKD